MKVKGVKDGGRVGRRDDMSSSSVSDFTSPELYPLRRDPCLSGFTLLVFVTPPLDPPASFFFTGVYR